MHKAPVKEMTNSNTFRKYMNLFINIIHIIYFQVPVPSIFKDFSDLEYLKIKTLKFGTPVSLELIAGVSERPSRRQGQFQETVIRRFCLQCILIHTAH